MEVSTPPAQALLSKVQIEKTADELLIPVAEKPITRTIAVAEVVGSEPRVLLPESKPIELVVRLQAEEQAKVAELAVDVEQPQPVTSERPSQPERVSTQRAQMVIQPKFVLESQPSPVVEAVVAAEYIIEEANVAPSQVPAAPEVVGDESTIGNEVSFYVSTAPQEQEALSLEEPPLLADELLLAPEVTQNPVEIFATWIAETVALHEASPVLPEMPEGREFLSETTQTPEREWPIALLQEIAINLAELPVLEAEGLLPVLHEVLAVSEYVRALDTEEDSPISKEQAVLRLTELYIRLLDTLEIDYEEEHLERIVAMLVSEAPDLLPSEKQQIQEIPHDVGTHEHRRFKRLIRSTDSVGFSTQRMVGSLGLAGFGLVWFGTRIAQNV